MTTPQFLDLSADRRIAYHKTEASNAKPGVVFLGGFKSDMEGTKALHLEKWAQASERAFLRFDYTGHGQSSGVFDDGCIGEWADDAFEAVTRLTDGPQILVGSSMGGWISLLLAKREPQKIAAFIGVAAAPDFTVTMRVDLNEDQQMEMERNDRVELPSEYSEEPYVITRKLLDDGSNNLVLTHPLKVDFPIRLLQGTEDEDVPVALALRLFDHLEGPDLRLTLVDGADHRFSEPRELAFLIETVEALS